MQPQQHKQDSQDGQDEQVGKKEEQPLMCMPNEAIAGIDEQAVGQVRPSKVLSNAEGLVGRKQVQSRTCLVCCSVCLVMCGKEIN